MSSVTIGKNIFPRLEMIYTEICRMTKDEGVPPTVRELCAVTGISSTSLMHYYLIRLEQANLIRRPINKSRNIVVVGAKWVLPEDAPMFMHNPYNRRRMGLKTPIKSKVAA